MAVAVEIPKLGNTVEECLISKWLKEEGQTVAAGEPVVEIETDKTSFEVEAPIDGTLLAQFFPKGALVPVFTKLFVIGNPGENVDAFRPQGEGAAPASDATGQQARGAGKPRVEDRPVARATGDLTAGSSSASMSPRARRFAEEHNFHPAAVTGSGAGGRVIESDLRAAYHSSSRVSDAASQRAQSGAIAPREGSGLGGMVLASDMGEPESRLSGVRETIANVDGPTGVLEDPPKLSTLSDQMQTHAAHRVYQRNLEKQTNSYCFHFWVQIVTAAERAGGAPA